MKKKMAVLAAGVCALAVLVTGCSKEISNDYVKVKQYKGIEVEKADTAKVTDESMLTITLVRIPLSAKCTPESRAPVKSSAMIINSTNVSPPPFCDMF